MRFLVIAAVLLTGCASRGQTTAELDAAREARITRMEDTCERVGYAKGSDAGKACVLDLIKADIGAAGTAAAGNAAARAAGAAAIMNNRPRTCTQVGAHTVCN